MSERSEYIEYLDLLGDMPCDSGYYWVKFEGLKFFDLCYLYADDMDAGARRARFITGKEMHEGDWMFKGSRWFEIHQPLLPNTKIDGRQPSGND